MSGNHLYPIFLKLESIQVVIIGAGNVGLEKLESILTNSPETEISIIGKEINEKLRILVANYKKVVIHQKEYQKTDLLGKQLVIACTDDFSVNQQIKNDATSLNLLVNVADTPHLCDFYLSSIVKKGDLKIAISTNGKSPTIAKRIKEMLLEILPDTIDEILQRMPMIRSYLINDFSFKVKKLNEITQILSTNPKDLEKTKLLNGN
jgi:uncharacterized protein